MLGLLLGGAALGVLGARLLGRKSAAARGPTLPEPAPVVLPVVNKPAANVPKAPVAAPPAASAENAAKGASFKSMSQLQGREPRPAPDSKASSRAAGNKGKSVNQSRKNPADQPIQDWTVPHRPAAMNPTQPPVPANPNDQPLETGQTIEWAAPTSTPPAIQELIEASEVPAAPPETSAVEISSEPAASATATGPVHYYAPAPDVPSIEHRKLSPNPLPQMPVLITLPHAEATTAQFSFSPQADQSRIIGNGVRELKEFFAFELPPTEQFTAIKNLMPGKLEKRDDAWHVVQKAEIALS